MDGGAFVDWYFGTGGGAFFGLAAAAAAPEMVDGFFLGNWPPKFVFSNSFNAGFFFPVYPVLANAPSGLCARL